MPRMGRMDTRRYEIQSTLGEGGFGTVYLARLQTGGGFSKQVALKVLREALADGADIASRLRDEARILGLLRHRALVHVDGLVRISGRWAVVMEYVDGVDLKAVHRYHGAMPVGPVLDLVAEVAGALHVAYHTEGQGGRPLKLLHRDIKPGNIQLTPAGEVKVLDFGVARADFEAREAETRAVRFGSAGYLAPERLTGREGPAADVYSLGVVAVEMLSGKRYGQVATTPAAQLAQVADKVGSLQVHADIRDLLGQMLVWDPDARVAARDVERLAARLRAQVSGTEGAELLRDWAEREVPEIARRAAGKPPTPGDLVGQTVTEELLPVSATIPILPSERPDPSAPTVLTRERGASQPPAAAEAPAKAPPSTALWVGLAVGFAVVLGLALGVALLAVGAYAGRWSGG